MEFKFNVNDVLKDPVVEISNNLVPPRFTGDRRELWNILTKMAQIVNEMGEASAMAQGLPKAVTTAERLRNSDHKLYFLLDQNANNGNGAVTGMLKIGKKNLYVFDRNGRHYQVTPPCILDFYIHESRQRKGLGKQLFEHMLQKEQVNPLKMAIDRPSDKLLRFMNKHYALNSPVKQMNNYVVYDGFFPTPEQCKVEFGSNIAVGKKESANGLQNFSLPLGRYGALKPPSTMGEIIHNQTTTNKNQEATGLYPTYAAQSAPNIPTGGPIQNNALHKNTQSLTNYTLPNNANQARIDNTRTSAETMQHNMRYNNEMSFDQNQRTNLYNYQQHNNIPQQPPMEGIMQNPNLIQQNSPVQYNTQNPQNDYYAQTIQNTTYPSNFNNINNRTQVHPQQIANYNNENMAQQTQYQTLGESYQTKLEPQQITGGPINVVASQYQINHPVDQHQYQQYPNGTVPDQNYISINKGFENLNLNNQPPLPGTVPTQLPTNISSTNNMNVRSQSQDAYQNGRIGQGESNDGKELGQLGYQINTSDGGNANFTGNVNKTNSPNVETFTQNITSNNMPQMIPQHPLMITPQSIVEPHMYYNQNIQQNVPVGYQGDTRKLSSNNLHTQSLYNVPQQHFPPTHPYNEFNVSNMPNALDQRFAPPISNIPFNTEVAQNATMQHSATNVPITYTQRYSSPNLNVAASKSQVDNPHSQTTSAMQIPTNPLYNDRNVANAPAQPQNTIGNESGSAVNMSNNSQNRLTDNIQVESKSTHNVQYPAQMVNQNISREDARVMS